MSNAKLASYFVHEMTHVRQQKLGKSVDVSNSDSDEFIKANVNEEFIATAFQMQFFVRLDVGGYLNSIKPLTDKNAPPRYDQYKSAYNAGVTKMAGKGFDEEKLITAALGNAISCLKYLFLRAAWV
ncbi:hypothetical protein FOHLNKBM_2120 [Methylobacterium longum]|nr:hypothetical protein FOHLNKBM_2120 [Methylobacterium longum]